MAIIKSVDETIVLIPTDIPFEYRDRYEYQWEYRHDVFSNDYEAHFVPLENGDHRFNLVTINKTTGLRSEKEYLVHVVGERKAAKPIFAITCIYEISSPGSEEAKVARKRGGEQNVRVFYDARDYGLDYSDDIKIAIPLYSFPRSQGATQYPIVLGPVDFPNGWFWEGEESLGYFKPLAPLTREALPAGLTLTAFEFYTNLPMAGSLKECLNNPLRALLSGIAPQAQRWLYISEKDERWSRIEKRSPKTNMIFITCSQVYIPHE